jgi:hypothetical protein
VPVAVAVTLTADEVHFAASHGLVRRHAKLSGNRGDRMQRYRSTWDNEIEGVCAELAFCKLRGIYWSGLGGIRAKDGGEVDVRWTKHEGTGGLIVYPHDPDDGRIVLMDGFAPTYRVIGWIVGVEAKRDEWLKDFGYLVPRNELRRIV